MRLLLLDADYNLIIEPLWLLTNCMPGADFVIDADGAEITRWLASVFETIPTSARLALKLFFRRETTL